MYNPTNRTHAPLPPNLTHLTPYAIACAYNVTDPMFYSILTSLLIRTERRTKVSMIQTITDIKDSCETFMAQHVGEATDVSTKRCEFCNEQPLTPKERQWMKDNFDKKGDTPTLKFQEPATSTKCPIKGSRHEVEPPELSPPTIS